MSSLHSQAEPVTGGSLKRGGGGWRLLGSLLVSFATIEVLTIGLSLARFRIDGNLARLIVLAAGISGCGYWYYLGRNGFLSLDGDSENRLGRWVLLLLSFSAVLYASLWVLAYILPDGSWDGLWYHAPTVHFWALRDRVHWITTDYCEFWSGTVDPNWNGYPKGVELLGFILVRASGMVRLLNAFQLLFIPLGVLGIYCIAGILGANRRWALSAALLFVFVPVNIAQSITTYVDTATASIYIALLAVIAFSSKFIRRGYIPWFLLPALGSGLGLAIAAKGTGILLIIISSTAMALFSLSGAREIRRGNHRNYPAGEAAAAGRRLILRGVIFSAASVAIALAVGGYWYFRNYHHTGSPFHPIGVTVLGREVFPGVPMETQFPVPHIQKISDTEEWPQVKRLAFNWLQGLKTWDHAATRVASRSGGMGFLWLFGCLPSIFVLFFRALRRRPGMKGDRRAVFFFLAAALAVLFFVMPKHHNHVARYTIWLYALGLPCFAVVVQDITRRARGPFGKAGLFWAGLVTASLLFEGLYGWHYQASLVRDYRQRWQGRERRLPSPSTFLTAIREDYPVGFAWANLKGTIFDEIHSGSDTVALSLMYGPHMDGWRMPGNLVQGRAFGRREIYFFDFSTTAHDPARLPEFLASRRVRYVIWDKGVRVPRPLARLVDEWHSAGDFYVLEFFPREPTGREQISIVSPSG